MKERPIIFSGPMVRAIIEGRKSQTRRAVKVQPRVSQVDPVRWSPFLTGKGIEWMTVADDKGGRGSFTLGACPYGVPGDRLWVRETWQAFFADEVPADRPRGPRHTMGIPANPKRESFVFYRADGELEHPRMGAARWRSPIHLPRWASRLTLEVTGVRVERLNGISEKDAWAEGVPPDFLHRAKGYAPSAFRILWESINGPGSWAANPWVWVIEFRRV